MVDTVFDFALALTEAPDVSAVGIAYRDLGEDKIASASAIRIRRTESGEVITGVEVSEAGPRAVVFASVRAIEAADRQIDRFVAGG